MFFVMYEYYCYGNRINNRCCNFKKKYAEFANYATDLLCFLFSIEKIETYKYNFYFNFEG